VFDLMQKEIDWYYKLIAMRNLLYITEMYLQVMNLVPIPVVTRSKARAATRLLGLQF
jgi:hypothetical protein